MPVTSKITHKPAGKYMTISELEAALAEARAYGATGSDVPTVRIHFSGAIKEFRIEIEAAEGAPGHVEDRAG